MKNIKKMILALTMLTLGSAYISAMGYDPRTGEVYGPPHGPAMGGELVQEVTPFWPIIPKFNPNNKSGQWYEKLKTASVGVGIKNQIDYTDVYEKSGMTGSQNGQGNTDFTPPAGYEQIGISVIGSGSGIAGYGMSYLFGKPAQADSTDKLISNKPIAYEPTFK